MLYYPRQSRRFDDGSCSVVVVVVVVSVPTDAVLGRLRFHKKESSEVEDQQREDKYSLKAQYQQQVGACRGGIFCVHDGSYVVQLCLKLPRVEAFVVMEPRD